MKSNRDEKEKMLKEKDKELQESLKTYKSEVIQHSYMKLSTSVVKVHEANLPGLTATFRLSPVSSGTFWASGDDRNLIQFDLKGNKLNKIPASGQVDGFHTITTAEELLYTDYEKKSIYRVDTDMTTEAFFDTGEWRPWSIFASHYNGDILVGMKKNKEWKITRYNREGMSFHDIQKKDNGEELYSDVSYMTEKINGDICTSDIIAREMVVVNRS
ncbi:uncharacterized protein LOC134232386 [Saccostrea cucullata]|uniref:uncharacterized protein LOC134232386 n=1 Tax=Saccostrea cuccullata TaxID=36930 RepID=UPI002ED3BF47